MKNKIFTSPMNISERDFDIKSIFLAGSIENDNLCADWQSVAIDYFSHFDLNIFNPRRKDWNIKTKQEFEDPNLYQQINWELNALDASDIILMYFNPDTKSPISLLELGLYANSGKFHVICEAPFYRKGNVDMVCNKYNIPMYNGFNDFDTYFNKHFIKAW
jgi:hypothetical protein